MFLSALRIRYFIQTNAEMEQDNPCFYWLLPTLEKSEVILFTSNGGFPLVNEPGENNRSF